MADPQPVEAAAVTLPKDSPCQTCGACCSFAPDWPRFTMEEESDLDRIPTAFVATDLSGMRCDGDRCSALAGEVGVATRCTLYEVRPIVCRACKPGDEACRMARARFGLTLLAV